VGKVRVLDDAVARKIAAGEVIERPVSVVKELVENALDAGATRVVVEIDQGGRSRIAVTDDGEGIAREDVLVAFEPHATSKIRSEDDLTTIATLGFRGEALPSIAAVSEVELWTCRRGDAIGTHVRLHGGRPIVEEEVGTAVGCRIEVRDLFVTTPARRKFLKAPATEAGHVVQLVSRLALARPEIGFTLRQDGRESASFPPATTRERVRKVLGNEVAAELCALGYDGAVRVSGFVTHPHFSVPHSRSLLFFVNGRLIRDRLLQHAVLAAYATLLPHGRYPAAVVFADVPADAVDVNVHPTKLEVRFRDGNSVHEGIGRAVREAIAGAGGAVSAIAAPRVAEALAGYAAREAGGGGSTAAASSPPGRSALRLVPAEPAASPSLPLADGFSSLGIVGQVFDGYLVCQRDAEIVLIDQHAAHERVAFERLSAARRAGSVERQAMLVPQPVEVGPGEVELLAGAAAELEAAGLDLEPFGRDTVLVRTIPALLPAASIAPLVRAIAAELAEHDRSRALEARADGVLATIACHSVVRVGQKLSEPEMRALLAAMDSVDLNSNCPHGRPVARRLSRAEIERRFGR
jgi:DNA mismatch repair protein MutL